MLAQHFLVTCGQPACAREANGREIVAARDLQKCTLCGGSANRRAVRLAEATFARHGVSRIVIVGGSPSVHEELLRLKPPSWELRLIDGTLRRTSDLARADLKWADLVLVWGSSELDHKVSGLYLTRDYPHPHAVLVNRRGIAALLDAAVKHYTGGR